MTHSAQRFVVPVVCSILCACGGGGGKEPTPPPKQGSQVIADVDTDDDGLIEISTLEHLDWVRNDFAGTSFKDHEGRVNANGCRVGGCNGYELTADLNFDTNGDGMMDQRDAYFDHDRNGSNAGWRPIRLTGNFEGNGHRIFNLFINRPNKDYVGLIEIVEAAAGASVVIRNLEIAGALTSITGRNFVGALVGAADVSGSVQVDSNRVSGRVAGRGSVTGGLVGQFSITRGQLTVRANQSSAYVEGVGHGVGGLIGQVLDLESTPGVVLISDNDAVGLVSSNETAGGLVGVVAGDITIENCSSSAAVTGLVAGGLIGTASGRRLTLRYSRSTGSVARNATSVSNIASTSGGLIGSLYAQQVTITDVRVTADAVSGNSAGGLVGTAWLSRGVLDIRNAFAEVGVIGGESSLLNLGGLIGFLWVDSDGQFSLSDSFANGTMTGRSLLGGLVGNLRAEGAGQITIANVFALGDASAEDFVGGLFGKATALNTASITVRNSYAVGDVDASNGMHPFAGGLAGEASADPMSTAKITFENSYWATDTTGRHGSYGAASSRTFSNGVTGAPLDQLSCPGSANDRNCWTSELYHFWETALSTTGQPVWKFRGPGKLPALTFGGAIYQPVIAAGGVFVVSQE
jgi:hypothetical protein